MKPLATIAMNTPAPRAPRAMPLPAALVYVPATAVCALLIEACLMVGEAVSTIWTVCIVGNEKAKARRRFK
jgi:hypothetical protein